MASGSSKLSIDELTMGVSGTGMDSYIKALQLKIVTQTVKKLENLKAVTKTIKSGWAGQSYDAFEKDLLTRIAEIKTELEAERDDLNKKLLDVKGAYYAIDRDLYRED